MSEESSESTSAATILGTLILVIGLILLFGNMTGMFPTFPYAGFIGMVLGGLIMKLGKN